MVDKAKLAEQQARGASAENILNNPLLQEVLVIMRDESLKAWSDSLIDDVALREDCFRMVKTVERFESCFKEWMRTGEFATKDLLTLKSEEKEAA